MRVLVTGSQGVIGSALVQTLLARDVTVCGVDLFHTRNSIAGHPHLYAPKGDFEYARADVGNYRELLGAIRYFRPDLVYHTAAEFGRWNGEVHYETMWRTNVVGTRNMLELQYDYGFRCIYFSSSEVYGDSRKLILVEDDAQNERQMNDYAISKWANELQVRSTRGVDTGIVRIFNTYGPGEYFTPYRSVVCRFIYHLLKGEYITVHRGHYRCHTWLPDCVNALANILDVPEFCGPANIGGKQHHSIEELAEIIQRIVKPSKDLIRYEKAEPRTTRTKTPDNSIATQLLGFKETVTLEEGIEKTVHWMRGIL